MQDFSGDEDRSSSGGGLRHLSILLEEGTSVGLTDGQLLGRFLSRGSDRSAEVAFAALLERHGGMVLRVCREILGNAHDADDAFQAVFLILAKNARTIRHQGSVGPWLYGVALRVARRARSNSARRRRLERKGATMREFSVDGTGPGGLADPAIGRTIHDEIGRLSEKHRAPVVLCYLEGLTHEMAASQLGCPVGTIRSRLAWARDRLKIRLTRRGIAPSLLPAGLFRVGEVVVSPTSKVSISSALTETTLRAAMRIASGNPALAGVVSAPVAALIEEGMRAMFWTKLKLVAVSILAAGVITTGAGVAAYSYRANDGSSQQTTKEVAENPAPKKAQATPPKSESKQTKGRFGIPPEVEEKQERLALDRVRELIRDFDTKQADWIKTSQEARTKSPQNPVASTNLPPRREMYEGALFLEGERFLGTQAAEEAFFWIVKLENFGSIVERSKAYLARDYAATGQFQGLFVDGIQRFVHWSWGSPATEALLREIASKNKLRENRGRATYCLAHLLVNQANNLEHVKLYGDSLKQRWLTRFSYPAWGEDFPDQLTKKDPRKLMSEAGDLFRQVSHNPDYSTLPVEDKMDKGYLDRPANLGAVAKINLGLIERLRVGNVAPEIAGVDLDGQSMKLSDYWGKVVAIYFCPTFELPNLTTSLWDVANRYREKSFVVLGVPLHRFKLAPQKITPALRAEDATFEVDSFLEPDRDSFRTQIQNRKLPVRFWWDEAEVGKIGPIRTAWHPMAFRPSIVLIDHRGVIRDPDFDFLNSMFFDAAVKTLLDEREKDLGR